MLAMMTTMSETRGRRMIGSGKHAMKQSETKPPDSPFVLCFAKNHTNFLEGVPSTEKPATKASLRKEPGTGLFESL